MTAPWSGSEEADGEEELAEGVGSADAVASAVGAAEGAAALGVVAAGLGALLTVACWRDRAVAAAPSEGGNDHEDGQERPDVLPLGRLGAVHADGHIFAGAVKFIPGVLRTHAFRLSEKRESGRGWRAENVAWPVRH